MVSTVQARLDSESRRELERLRRRLGWSPSRVVREGIRLLAACQPADASRRVVGVGRFASGKPDLGSNQDYLKGFGR